MIPKSGYRFSEKIMLKHGVRVKWTPVRRQEYAPTRESGARPDSEGTGRAL